MNHPNAPLCSAARRRARTILVPSACARALLLASAVILGLAAGCTTEPAAYPPSDTTKYTLEDTEKFVSVDFPPQHTVTCTGLQERTLADGRLEVIANIKNRENHRVEVQASCLFRDAQGFTIGDETPWQTVSLAENATEAVRFTANNTAAKRYTVQVRRAR